MDITGRRVRIAGGIAGVLFVVLALVAFFLPGMPPKANEAAKVTSYFVSKRSSILAGDYVLGLATMFFLLFVGSLRVHFAAVHREGVRPGAAVLAGGVAGATLLLAGAGITAGAVFRVGGTGLAPLTVSLYDLSNALFFLSGFGFAAFFGAAALTGAITPGWPRLLVPAAVLAAVVELVSAVGLFAKSGFFATGGAFGYISVFVALLWVLAASVVLLRGSMATVVAAAP